MYDWARAIEVVQANNRARRDALARKRWKEALDKHSLTLELPVTALGVDGETVLEIIIEYTQDRNHPVNPNKFVINIWIMESGINLKFGVTTLYAPTIEDEGPIAQAARILSVVSESKTIQEELAIAVTSLRKESVKHPELME